MATRANESQKKQGLERIRRGYGEAVGTDEKLLSDTGPGRSRRNLKAPDRNKSRSVGLQN